LAPEFNRTGLKNRHDAFMVVVINPSHYGFFEVRDGLISPFLAIEDLFLEPPEEILRRGVVEAIAFPGHGLPHAVFPEKVLKPLLLVLPALVAVHDGPNKRHRRVLGKAVHHPFDLMHIGMLREIISHYLPGVEVDDGGQVQLHVADPELGDVRPEDRACDSPVEMPFDQIGRRHPDLSLVRAVPLGFWNGRDMAFPHDSGHFLLVYRHPQRSELDGHPGAPVFPVVPLEDAFYLIRQGVVFMLSSLAIRKVVIVSRL